MEVIDKICQISDIHLRNYHRHQEYREVFQKMFQKIDEVLDDKTIIVLTGDIAHSKNEVSPELISLISELFTECARRCPTIIIPGNHDANLSNEHRLDVLTPIVDALNNPNIYYWKESGVYEIGNIAFNHYSVFGKQSKWIAGNKMETDKEYRVGLYHGIVHGASTDIGYEVESDTVRISKFNSMDMVLLGDIHMRQTLQEFRISDSGKKYPAIKFPGSLIQQNFGESLEKGFEIWDVPSRTSTFIPVENNYGFYTCYLLDDKKLNKDENLPKNLRLRIFHENCTKEYIYKVIASYKRKHKILDVMIRDQKPASTFDIEDKSLLNSNSRDVEYQNSMLKLYFENENIIDIDLDFLRQYNRSLNSKIVPEIALVRNAQWKPKYFEFSNMFSYGENNFVNFDGLNGINGIFAKNASGKTSLGENLLFCLFDKCTKTFKASYILNNTKSSFQCKFIFEMDGKEYTIERIGILNDKLKTVRVDVSFKSFDGIIETDLTGLDRDDTNRIIREYLGSYDDFLTTVMVSQNKPVSVIDMSYKERNELFYRFLDIQIYNELFQLAKEDNKFTLFQIKDLEKQEYDEKLPELYLEKQTIESKIKLCETEISNLKDVKDASQSKIEDLSTEIQNIDLDIDIAAITSELELLTTDHEDIISEINQIKTNIKSIENLGRSLLSDLSNTDVESLKSANETFLATQRKLQKLYIEATKINADIKNKNEKIEHLKDHEYDPSCQYCIKNKFVADAKKAEIDLISLTERKSQLNIDIDQYQTSLKLIQRDITAYSEYIILKQTFDNNKTELQLTKNALENKIYRKKIIHNTIIDYQSKIKIYYEKENIIKRNKELRSQIALEKTIIFETDISYKKLIDKHIDILTEISKISSKIDEYESALIKLSRLRHESSNYEYYIQAMSKDGIPYLILNSVLPNIENEINNILSQIVDFTIKLEPTDKNNISGFIMYGLERQWPMELTSGMERFILSTAFRVGLMNITTLPSANFMIIDEGFGVLDADKLNNMYLLFDYLKSKFDFVLCISHIAALKDMVDSTISIEKVDGVSQIRH